MTARPVAAVEEHVRDLRIVVGDAGRDHAGLQRRREERREHAMPERHGDLLAGAIDAAARVPRDGGLEAGEAGGRVVKAGDRLGRDARVDGRSEPGKRAEGAGRLTRVPRHPSPSWCFARSASSAQQRQTLPQRRAPRRHPRACAAGRGARCRGRAPRQRERAAPRCCASPSRATGTRRGSPAAGASAARPRPSATKYDALMCPPFAGTMRRSLEGDPVADHACRGGARRSRPQRGRVLTARSRVRPGARGRRGHRRGR